MTLVMASCQERTHSPLPSSQKPKALPAPSRNKAAGQRKPLRLGVARPGSLRWGTAQAVKLSQAQTPPLFRSIFPFTCHHLGGFQELICGQYVCITASSWPFLSLLVFLFDGLSPRIHIWFILVFKKNFLAGGFWLPGRRSHSVWESEADPGGLTVVRPSALPPPGGCFSLTHLFFHCELFLP